MLVCTLGDVVGQLSGVNTCSVEQCGDVIQWGQTSLQPLRTGRQGGRLLAQTVPSNASMCARACFWPCMACLLMFTDSSSVTVCVATSTDQVVRDRCAAELWQLIRAALTLFCLLLVWWLA